MTIRDWSGQMPALALKVEDYCDVRAEVVEKVRQAFALLDAAEELNREHVVYGFPGDIHGRYDFEQARRKIDGNWWRFMLDRTGAAAIMDGQARKEFREGLEHGEVPPFTLDNVTTHFLSMAQTSDAMFQRGVYNLFRRYVRIGERGYQTNRKDPFSIPRKLILDRWFSCGWGNVKFHVAYSAGDEVNDFGRIVNVLAGRPYVARGFETELNAAMTGSDLFENAIVKVRAFRNGNAHCWIKDKVLVDKINAQLAAYCGDTLAEAHSPSYGVNPETTLA